MVKITHIPKQQPDTPRTYIVRGLLPDKLYEFQVKARNSEGSSEWSTSALARTLP